MAEPDEDNSFLQGFMARAKKRQAKLAQIEEIVASAADQSDEVSYPPLSPLPEERTISPESHDEEPETTVDETNDEIQRHYRGNQGNDDEDDDDEDNHDDYQDQRRQYKAPAAKRPVLRPRSPSNSELNYSSDLSLSCDAENEDIHRAEPVICQSSPDYMITDNNLPHRASPRKQLTFHREAPLHQQQLQVQPQDSKPVPSADLQGRQPEPLKTSSQSLPDPSSVEKSLKDLQLKVDRAEQTRGQLKKVVELSKHGSKEHIEAARLLQITEAEHLSTTNYIALYKQGQRKKTESLGSIKISSIRLKLSTKMRNDLAEEGVSHYFFCVASCGMEVRATEIVNTDNIRKQDLKAYLQFKEKICFSDLPSEFIIKVEVYELVTGQQMPKFLSRLTPSKRSRITPESFFRRVGSMKLTLSDRNVSYKNLVQWSKHEESKYLERECKFELELRPEQLPSKSGMLHVRRLDSNGRPDWARFWVELAYGQIRFWKSNQDARDGKKPNHVIELQDLCSETVQKLTPDDDLYRQNSFVIYSCQQVTGGDKDSLLQRMLTDNPTFKLVKHQFTAETKEERDAWCSILAKSMNCFREWHGTNRLYKIAEVNEIFAHHN